MKRPSSTASTSRPAEVDVEAERDADDDQHEVEEEHHDHPRDERAEQQREAARGVTRKRSITPACSSKIVPEAGIEMPLAEREQREDPGQEHVEHVAAEPRGRLVCS